MGHLGIIKTGVTEPFQEKGSGLCVGRQDCVSWVSLWQQVSGVLAPELESLWVPMRGRSVPLPEVGWKS